MPLETVQVKILNFKIQKMNFKKWTGTNNQQKQTDLPDKPCLHRKWTTLHCWPKRWTNEKTLWN